MQCKPVSGICWNLEEHDRRQCHTHMHTHAVNYRVCHVHTCGPGGWHLGVEAAKDRKEKKVREREREGRDRDRERERREIDI